MSGRIVGSIKLAALIVFAFFAVTTSAKASPPTATVAVTPNQLGHGQTATVTITFSEAVTGFTLGDLTVSNATLSGLTTADNITYGVTLTAASGVTAATNQVTLYLTGVINGASEAGIGTAVSNNYSVGLISQTITFGAQAGRTYVSGGTFVVNPLATATSGLAVAYSSLTTGVCTVFGGIVTMVSAGTCTLAADQAGNSTYAAAAQVTQDVVIGMASGSVALIASPNPSFVGQAVTFTATVSGSSPTGSVTFKDGATTLGTSTLGSGQATLTTSALTSGTHAITAVYGGDANNASVTSSVLSQTVSQTTTTTVVISSANPSAPGQAVTFTATVTNGGATPAGTVSFNDGGVAIGTATLAGGIATLTTSALTVGTHTITAAYAGNGNFTASTSAALLQAVSTPQDSLKLRALQVIATKTVAQNSGAAITGAIDAAISEGFNDGGSLIMPGGSGIRFNFSADPDQRSGGSLPDSASGYAQSQLPQSASRVDDALAAINRQVTPVKAPAFRHVEPKDWLLWADTRGSGIDRWGSSTPILYGSQINALLGLTRRVTPNFLVGALVGYETFDYRSDALSGRLKGDGWTVGSYLGWRFAPGLRFDAAAAYSGIGYDGTAGTATGNFSGHRWLVSSGLTGNYKTYGFDIEPSAKFYALWERQNAYTDSLGTPQADHAFFTGRASAGMKLSYPWLTNAAVMLAPYAGFYADYYFTGDDAAALALAGTEPLASTPLLDGWSARATGGLAARLGNEATVALGAELGGIGSTVQTWTFRGRASLPF
ncbi:Ig-like domain repeat protein [Microbacteriaceae bacterium K1510]|nr:Ig-like domain repeat protein [Microbacteriaceae bacterium K1510]